MDFEYIQTRYKVNACIGREVALRGRKGVIVEDRGNYLGVTFHDDKPEIVHTCHPTWEMEYLGMVEIRDMPKVSRSKLRYREFMHSDCGLSFAEWLGIKKKD